MKYLKPDIYGNYQSWTASQEPTELNLQIHEIVELKQRFLTPTRPASGRRAVLGVKSRMAGMPSLPLTLASSRGSPNRQDRSMRQAQAYIRYLAPMHDPTFKMKNYSRDNLNSLALADIAYVVSVWPTPNVLFAYS